MPFPSLLAALALSATTLATPTSQDDFSLSESQNILPLHRMNSGKTPSTKALHSHLASKGSSVSLTPAESASEYLVDVTVGKQTFKLIFDTGSSDTWVPSQSFECVNEKLKKIPQSACKFGPLSSGTFTGPSIPNENFNITYGDGEFLTGILGHSSVTVGALTVPSQETALVTKAYWNGDGINSGLIGFAYPALTSAFKGNDPTTDNENTTRVQYSPWVNSAIKQHILSPPLFSVRLDRGLHATGSQLALGGLPTNTSVQKGGYVSVPLRVEELIPQTNTAHMLSFYTILPDGVVVKGTGKGAKAVEVGFGGNGKKEGGEAGDYAIVDSGTTLVYLPDNVLKALAKEFVPPAKYVAAAGSYEAACNAKVPEFGVKIGGRVFEIDSRDILLTDKADRDPTTGLCMLGVQSSGSGGPNILGDVFLRNVVAVFDVGNSKMRFAARTKY